MTVLLIGLVLFLGVHSLAIVSPGWRAEQLARRGDAAWKGLYSVVSLVGFVMIVVGYGLARQQPLVLYVPPYWMRHVTLLLMLPVFPLLLAAYLPGRIRAAAKHPMLLATKLWATAHLLSNGTLADVLLFGGFLAWAIADRISVKRRGVPLPTVAPGAARRDLLALGGGIALYLLFLFWAHRVLIGVSPLG